MLLDWNIANGPRLQPCLRHTLSKLTRLLQIHYHIIQTHRRARSKRSLVWSTTEAYYVRQNIYNYAFETRRSNA